jgi:hypothetical protein
LSSRKLIKALDKAIEERVFAADSEGAVSAAFMLLEIHENGWSKKVASGNQLYIIFIIGSHITGVELAARTPVHRRMQAFPQVNPHFPSWKIPAA